MALAQSNLFGHGDPGFDPALRRAATVAPLSRGLGRSPARLDRRPRGGLRGLVVDDTLAARAAAHVRARGRRPPLRGDAARRRPRASAAAPSSARRSPRGTAARCRRSRSRATATAATASPSTATASAASATTRSWPSSRSGTAPLPPQAGGRRPLARLRSRLGRSARDGRHLSAHVGARRAQDGDRRPAPERAVPPAASGPREARPPLRLEHDLDAPENARLPPLPENIRQRCAGPSAGFTPRNRFLWRFGRGRSPRVPWSGA